MSCAGPHGSFAGLSDAPIDWEAGMKKLINAPDDLLSESLDGFAAAHADILVLGEERKFVRRRQLSQGTVALISAAGSGHEPLHAGCAGRGRSEAAAPWHVCT